MLRLFGIVLLLGAALGGAGEVYGWEVPTVRFPFRLSHAIGWMNIADQDWVYKQGDSVFPWFGWLIMALLAMVGIQLLQRSFRTQPFSPITERRIKRFKSIRRGYVSFLVLIILGGLASLDHLLVGSEAVAVKYDGKWIFPALTKEKEKGAAFGLKGKEAEQEVNYRQLKRVWSEGPDDKGTVIMPLVPFAPTGDPVDSSWTKLTEEGDKLYRGEELFFGNASKVYSLHEPSKQHLRFRYRSGQKHGVADGWDREGNRIYSAKYERGVKVAGSEKWNGTGSVEEFLAQESSELCEVHYRPAPPKLNQAPRHLLGTTPNGYDVVAYLFGGLQVNFKAALVYIPIVYTIGITIGLLMGFFGGWFDLLIQRLIEIFSNIPFLFVVMIASTAVPEKLKETYGLWMILGILVTFGWMGMTYLMRTAALKEKSRDYIAASRVLGAGTFRIMFKHLLPNSIAIVVTLIPFSVSGLILSLTALDYLGFGLPVHVPSWGRLLKDGLEYLSAPWLVTAAFVSLVCTLVLITFVGEAIREAFDPKKFSYYR